MRSLLPDRLGFCRLLPVLVSIVALSPVLLGASDESLRNSLPRFTDVSGTSGITFEQINGERTVKNFIPETKGGGAGFFDYDRDGWPDLFLVQGSTVERYRSGKNPRGALYRNRHDGTFEDVTEKSRLISEGWGMGVAFGDYDNDGDPDVYITRLGPNQLFRNNGDGTFEEVTDVAGVGDPSWSTSAAFGDCDGDGDLDLYVANYLYINFDALPPKVCRHREAVVLCGPTGLPGARNSLYRNNGDGTFTEASEEVGAADSQRFYSLGVMWADLDNDGDQDLYVGNDVTPNLLYVNQGDGHFVEDGLLSGLAVNAEGREQASMGMDAADFDNDGLLDVYLTHFADDYSTLYRNEGELQFRDITARAQLLQAEIGLVGWGVKLIDFNNDGWKDIVHSNGHVYPYLIDAGLDEKFDEPMSFYANRGDGTFMNAARMVGEDFQKPVLGRGVAFADYDNDGDFDFLVVNLNGKPVLFRTDRRDANNWIMVRAVGTRSNRDGYGTRIEVEAGGMRQWWEVKSAGSIYSGSDPRAHFGLGVAKKVTRLHVRWPSGREQEFENLDVNRHYLVEEGRKPVIEPLERAR